MGRRSQIAKRIGIKRLAPAGVVPITVLSVVTELFPDCASCSLSFREVPKHTDLVGGAEAEKRPPKKARERRMSKAASTERSVLARVAAGSWDAPPP